MEHIFAGNPLDRGDVVRRDESLILINSQNPNARYLIMKDLNPLVNSEINHLKISWKTFAEVSEILSSKNLKI